MLILADPDVLDMTVLQGWADERVARANAQRKVGGVKLTAAVHPGCFPADEVNRVRKELHADPRVVSADVGLDSRMHVSLCGPAALAAELQRRYTPLVLAEARASASRARGTREARAISQAAGYLDGPQGLAAVLDTRRRGPRR